MLALSQLVNELNHEVAAYKTSSRFRRRTKTNVRNDMYLASEALRLMEKNDNPAFTAEQRPRC